MATQRLNRQNTEYEIIYFIGNYRSGGGIILEDSTITDYSQY